MKIHSFIAFGLVSIAALPATAASITDTNYTISASVPGLQFDTLQAGAADFANSAILMSYGNFLATSVGTITGGLSNPGGSTNPGSGVSGGTISSYIAASSGNPITITFNTPESYFGLLWGSMDPGNTITLYSAANPTGTAYTGTQLLADSLGLQQAGTASYINFNAANVTDAITKIVLTEPSTQFEVDNLATITAPVPLPASVYLMIAGLGVLGCYARKRKLAILSG